MTFPLLARVVLLLLSIAAQVPQFRTILSHHDVTGISGLAVLLNNLVALEQFAIIVSYIAIRDDAKLDSSIIQSPPSRDDWANIAQVGTTWFLSLIFFMLWVAYSPNKLLKWTYLIIWFLPSVVVIYISMALFADKSNNDFADFFAGIWAGMHRFYISPVCSVLIVIAFIPQFYILISTGRVGALSADSLLLVSVVYASLAASWPFRMYLAADAFRNIAWSFEQMALDWFQLVGWVPIDSALFALMQLMLYLVVLTLNLHGRQDGSGLSETSPLLR